MTDVFVGIDVSKDQLDVAARPRGESWQVANTELGIATLVKRLEKLQPTLVVLEATGRLESAAVSALAVAGVPLAIVNPRQVRDFARSTGKLAKTDKLDAQMLARFADAVRPEPRPLPDETQQRIDALLVRRRQLLGMITAERNRRRRAPTMTRAEIDEHVAWLQVRVEAIEDELNKTIRSSLLWREKVALLRSVPGCWPNAGCHDRGAAARARCDHAQGDRLTGGSRPAQSGQRSLARQAHDLGRPGSGARRSVYERARRHPVQSTHPPVLPATAGHRKAKEAGADRVHAKVADHSQCHRAPRSAVAQPSQRGSHWCGHFDAGRRLTRATVATPPHFPATPVRDRPR